MVKQAILEVTRAIEVRSAKTRARYLAHLAEAPARREALACSNMAHSMASLSSEEKLLFKQHHHAHIGIITSYNDMLSAHAPYQGYPEVLKNALHQLGASAQVAAGVPAMCDGVTQGASGMQLSLFSRDLIAQATAIGLTHGVFDGGLYLGVCDKIVPGLLIGALSFGHLPAVFVPAGPMASGIANAEKAKVRQAYAKGEVSREQLLAVEEASYHSKGTCTFYGTANTNQLLLEAMGLHVPGAAFVHPESGLREHFNQQAAAAVLNNTTVGSRPLGLGQLMTSRVIVNAVVALLASGGSTNHTLHLPAIAKAAGFTLTWDDIAALAKVVPLLARVYPNGSADVNQFQAAGGPAWIIRELLNAGLMHNEVATIVGEGLYDYCQEPCIQHTRLSWRALPQQSPDPKIVRTYADPFLPYAGLNVVSGNIGRAIVKTSAVDPSFWRIRAQAKVFDSEQAVHEAYASGQLTGDFVLVVRFQGPRANGMPELHQLMPLLVNLQQQGQRVALVTDGRLSGASGQVLCAIHVTPEAAADGLLAKVEEGDWVEIDAEKGVLTLDVASQTLMMRTPERPVPIQAWGYGLELFTVQRQLAMSAEQGGGWLYQNKE